MDAVRRMCAGCIIHQTLVDVGHSPRLSQMTDSRLLIQDGLLDDRLAITRLSTFGVDSSDSAKLSQRLHQSRPLSNAGLFDVFARRHSFV